MNNKGKGNEGSGISILEAVETLSDIADLEILPDIGIAEKHNIKLNDNIISYRSVQWMHGNEIEERLDQLREIFKVILAYLRDYYKKKHLSVESQPNIEGVKNIMLLVGEAAKKLDRFTALFNLSASHHVTHWKEYKQLQDFYLNHFARKIDEGVLSKWIYGLAHRAFMESPSPTIKEKEFQTKHVFVDLESVKKDLEYELFFMRKEDGTRFYSPRLIRNIKLICDFGDYIGERDTDDPLSDLQVWQDRFMHACAKDLYHVLKPVFKDFFTVGMKHKDKEIVELLRNTIMALALCSHPKHLSKNSPTKCCLEYFHDLQSYLRQVLQSREYQKLTAYEPDITETTACNILDTVHALCSGFYRLMKGYHEMIAPIQSLLREAKQDISPEHLEAAKKSHQLWSQLACDHTALVKLFKNHSSGPLLKVLNTIENDVNVAFDPLMQNNIPSQLFSLYFNETKIDCLHLPCPIHQDAINKASVNEEFKAFILDLKSRHSEGKHLIINLQDRTSWKEEARCKVLEELQFKEDFENDLVVVTIPKDTEFYYQTPPYLEEKHSEVFIKNLKNHVLSDSSGFFFPKAIKQQLASGFIESLAQAVLRIFFHNKNVLLQENRMDFIEIFYVFLQLKLIEIVKPSSFSFTCKDCLDIGSSTSALLFSILKLLNEDRLNDHEIDYINVLLYASSILIRERLISPERFKRYLNALKLFEVVRDEHNQSNFKLIAHEAFGRLFKSNILDSILIIP